MSPAARRRRDVPPLMAPTENPFATDATIERMKNIEKSPLFMIEMYMCEEIETEQ